MYKMNTKNWEITIWDIGGGPGTQLPKLIWAQAVREGYPIRHFLIRPELTFRSWLMMKYDMAWADDLFGFFLTHPLNLPWAIYSWMSRDSSEWNPDYQIHCYQIDRLVRILEKDSPAGNYIFEDDGKPDMFTKSAIDRYVRERIDPKDPGYMTLLQCKDPSEEQPRIVLRKNGRIIA